MSSEGYVMNPVMPRSSACEPSSIDSADKTRLQCAIEERRASSWLNHSAAEDFVNNLKVEDLDTEHHTSAMDIISNNPVLKSFIAGSLSGTFSTVMFQPLDLVKTRLQNTVPAAVGHRSSSMITIMVHILRKEHLAGLWKGMTPSITRCVPGVGLYFSSLHWLKSHLVQGDPGPMQAVALGMMARTLSGVLLIPITVVKTRFESGVYQYGGVTEALRVIYRTEGARGLCCGLLPTLIRDAPFSGIYLMFYTQAKKTVPQEWLQQTSAGGNSFTHFGCGVIAGVMASVVTQPADVLKTKMQLYPHKFSSVLSVVMYVQKTYGFRGYFKGLAPRMLRRTLMAAMAWTVYEQITRQIGLK